MMESFFAFFATQSGLYFGLILILIGISDVIIGVWILKKRVPDAQLREILQHPQLKTLFTVLLSLSIFLMLFGAYIALHHI